MLARGRSSTKGRGPAEGPVRPAEGPAGPAVLCSATVPFHVGLQGETIRPCVFSKPLPVAVTPTPACLPEGRICCGVPYFVGGEYTHFRQSHNSSLPSHGRGGGRGGLGSFFSRCTQKSCCSLSFLRPTNIDGRASEKQKETRQQTASEAAKAESAHHNCC